MSLIQAPAPAENDKPLLWPRRGFMLAVPLLPLLAHSLLAKITPAPIASAAARAMATTAADPVFDQVQQVGPGVFFAQGRTSYFADGNVQELFCNNGWVVFDDFVLVVDANMPEGAKQLHQAIRRTTDRPIRYVFNTHHHGDHLYGNQFWFEKGATLLAHTGVVEELKKFETGYYQQKPGRWEQVALKRPDVARAALVPPFVTFTDSLVVEDKHRRVELRHVGRGHTAGDGVVWLPKEKILFAGDACLTGPYNIYRDAYPAEWVQTLVHLQREYAPAVLLPGHGPQGTGDSLERQRYYFQFLLDWVGQQGAGASWEALEPRLPQLRAAVQADSMAKAFLVPEPAVVPTLSLATQIQRIVAMR